MKRLVMLCILSLLLIGCAETEKPFSAWLAGDQDAAMLRLGTMVTQNNEVGAVVQHYPNGTGDLQDRTMAGVYGCYHFGDTVEINNPLNAQEIVYASTYVGAQYTTDRDYKNNIRPFVGFTFNLDPNVSRESGGLFIEYQDQAYDSQAPDSESKVLLGLRFRF